MPRISDKTKKKILADRALGLSIRELSKKHHVSTATAHKLIKDNSELTQQLTQKVEQINTENAIKYVNQHLPQFEDFFEYFLGVRLNVKENSEELDKVSIKDLATIFGILSDKFMKAQEIGLKGDRQTHDIEQDKKKNW